MGGYTVDPDELAALGAAARSGATTAREELRHLGSRADRLIGGGWVGPAGRHFARGWWAWHDAVTLLLDDLEALGSAVQESSRSYAGTEAAVGAAIATAAAP